MPSKHRLFLVTYSFSKGFYPKRHRRDLNQRAPTIPSVLSLTSEILSNYALLILDLLQYSMWTICSTRLDQTRQDHTRPDRARPHYTRPDSLPLGKMCSRAVKQSVSYTSQSLSQTMTQSAKQSVNESERCILRSVSLTGSTSTLATVSSQKPTSESST